jgi:hypothetical protein
LPNFVHVEVAFRISNFLERMYKVQSRLKRLVWGTAVTHYQLLYNPDMATILFKGKNVIPSITLYHHAQFLAFPSTFVIILFKLFKICVWVNPNPIRIPTMHLFHDSIMRPEQGQRDEHHSEDEDSLFYGIG